MMQKKKQIVNIINFIRGCEPREEVDLEKPVREQMALLRQYGLPGTFLLQYDALCQPVYAQMLKEGCADNVEFGVWLEIVEGQAEAAGIPWRGRFPWDWHANVGFSVGYTLRERERLIDVLFEKFHEVFGYYPRSMGSWALDAHTVAYAERKYGLDALCDCKDQWGTDGYTMWGGYYNQAYYPSRNNVFSPAQSDQEQIRVPMFRMLGSDPIYQYDFGLDGDVNPSGCQGVVTLEPVYAGHTGGGGVDKWVDWYFKENFSGNCLTFAYTQAGQENSFGWERMAHGLQYQFAEIARLAAEGKLDVETLGESGRWFKQNFVLTPASTVVAESDWMEKGHQTVWYNCRRYRINLLRTGNRLRIRDLYLFDEYYRERYFDAPCKESFLQFDTLPVIDGNRFGGKGVLAGLVPMFNGGELTVTDMRYEERDAETAVVAFDTAECGRLTFTLTPDGICCTVERGGEGLVFVNRVWQENPTLPACSVSEKRLTLVHNHFEYQLELSCGRFERAADGLVTVVPAYGCVTLRL